MTVRQALDRPRWTTWTGPAAVVLAGVLMLIWSWGRWPDMMIDFGRELYVPWQLSTGKVLYRDLAYFHGPLSPYFNTLVFAVLGPGLIKLAMVNLLFLVITALLLWQLVAALAGRLATTVCGLVFMTTFAFAHPIDYGNCNFMTPYSHEMTHGTVLSLLSLFLLWRYLHDGRRAYLAGAGFALGLTFLTKPEFFIAAAPAVAAGIIARAWVSHARFPGLVGALSVLAVGALAAPLLAWLALCMVLSPSEALRGVLGSWPELARPELRQLRFYQIGMGLDDLGTNIRIFFAWTLRYVLLLAPAALAARFIRRDSRWRRPATAAACLIVGLPLVLRWAQIPWSEAGRPLPLFLVVAAVFFIVGLVRDRRTRTVEPRRILALAFTLFCGLLLLKMALNVRLYHYGFALALPATMLAVVAMVDLVPKRIDRHGGYGTLFQAVAIVLLAIFVGVYLQASIGVMGRQTHWLGRGADAFRVDARGRVVQTAMNLIDRIAPPDGTVAVVPEGIMLNYLMRRRNPTPFTSLMPPEIIVFGEQRILRAFVAQPPDIIVIPNRYEEFYGLFGRDYGIPIMAWIQENYRLVEEVKDPALKRTEFAYFLVVQRKDLAGGGEQSGPAGARRELPR